MEDKRGFKRKTIVSTIEHKAKDWIKTLPKELQEPVENTYILTGGAITSMLQGEIPNDYDFYFSDGEVAAKVANYYLSTLDVKNDRVSKVEAKNCGDRVKIMIKSAGIAGDGANLNDYRYFESRPEEELDSYFEQWHNQQPGPKPYKVAMISTNAISLYNDVQIITRFVGAPEEIHKNYDFVHCTNWYTHKDGLVLNQAALEAILAKELKYVGSKYPICSMFRIKKFIQRGWTITAGEMLKIAWDINKLDLDKIEVLMDQLTGVDAAYFLEVISILKKQKDKQIDRTYLFEVINRVFDQPDDFVSFTKNNETAMVDVQEIDSYRPTPTDFKVNEIDDGDLKKMRWS